MLLYQKHATNTDIESQWVTNEEQKIIDQERDEIGIENWELLK